jgi:chaperonin GroEL
MVTYGPRGGVAALNRAQGLLHTKDGATVAQEISLSDPAENLGAQLIRQACLSVNESVGDGTTTTAILAHALIYQGHRALSAGVDPTQLIEGIRIGVAHAIETIKSQSVPVDKQLLQYIAGVASNQATEIAEAMTAAALAVGKDGTILVEDGPRVEVELEFKEGIEIESGWAHSRDFMTDYEKMECHQESVLVAVVSTPLDTPMDVASIMEEASTFRVNDRDIPDHLLILAPRVSGDALMTINMNNQRWSLSAHVPSRDKKLPIYMAVNAPGVGSRKVDHLGDIAAAAGATLVDPLAGMDHRQFKREWFGGFDTVALYRNRSVFTASDDNQESLAQRLRVLRVQEHLCKSDHDRDQLRLRRARLSGGICVLKFSSHSEAALKERRARAEDTLAAIRSALQSGVVPGGGATFLTASEELRAGEWPTGDLAMGLEIVARTLETPARILAQPTSTIGQVLDARLSGGSLVGFDAASGRVRNLTEHPAIIDPTDVAVESLRAAASVATTFLTTEVSITMVK